jgi:thiol-disulfide isomerase/thioredoxin
MTLDKNTSINGGTVVGKVYAEWCGACKALKPNWHKMEKMVGGKVRIVKFENEKDKTDLVKFEKENNVKIQVNGFPTMFKMNGGQVSYYDGGRSPEELSTWALGKEQKQDGGMLKYRKNPKSKKNKSRKNKTRKNRK